MTTIVITSLESKTSLEIVIPDHKKRFYEKCIQSLYADYLYTEITDINGNKLYFSKELLLKNFIEFKVKSVDDFIREQLNNKLKETLNFFETADKEEIDSYITDIFPEFKNIKENNENR